MNQIVFVCSGNICRSPMAEFIFRDLVRRRHLEGNFVIESAGTTVYAPNSPVHNGTQRKLRQAGIPYFPRGSVGLCSGDYDRYDLLVGMERTHVEAMRRLFGGDPEGKLCRMLDFSAHPRDIDDPWYTGDFEASYRDITEGCETLLEHILKEQNSIKQQKGDWKK